MAQVPSMPCVPGLLKSLLLPLLFASACTMLPTQQPPMPMREFRGVWVATVDNIDWPSKKGLSTAAAQQELLTIVETTSELGLNAIVFQVRPCGDAFYESAIEPWSEWLTGTQGRAPTPKWDPLAFLVDAAHQKGIEVHAWFNPYRMRHPAALSKDAPTHAIAQAPKAVVRYGSYLWMDPGAPESSEWTLRVIQDVVRRYDIDGVHLDDYFYPYPEKGAPFPDDASYARYRQTGGKLARDDWRRSNIDRFVHELYIRTHAQKPFVKVGISPFGIARKGEPKGVQAGIDQHDQLYADVLGWLERGDLDYLAPQLYWPIDQKAQSFDLLLPYWRKQAAQKRHLWPGLSSSRAAQQKAPWRSDELPQQIARIRKDEPAPGHMFFSYKTLKRGSPLFSQLAAACYQEAAAPPASPWLGKAPVPARPQVQVGADGAVSVRCDDNARACCIQVRLGAGWRTIALRGPTTSGATLPKGTKAVAVRGIGRNGELGLPTIVTIR